MIICRGRKRVRQLYLSRKNKLLVHMERDRDGRIPGYFLLRYESEYTASSLDEQNYRLSNIAGGRCALCALCARKRPAALSL